MRLEPHRIGAANADLYCVALKDSTLGIVFRDNVSVLLVFKSLKHFLNSRFQIFVVLLFSNNLPLFPLPYQATHLQDHEINKR